MRHAAKATALALIMTAAGCERPLIITPRWAVTYGKVVTATGVAVPGARLTLRPDGNGRCPASAERQVSDAPIDVTTDAAGLYRAMLVLWEDLESTCVHIAVVAPSGALRDTSLSVGPVRFTERTARDSTRADITLGSR